jgi:tRNA-Thr(GGU) m(6)t(6)A37 methyltransferase TsaA
MGNPETDEAKETLEFIQLKPIGIVKNQSREASWGKELQSLTWQERAARMKEQSQAVSELIISPELEDMLDGIDEFSHLLVLYWSHLIPGKRRQVMKVHPLGSKDFPLVGTFATHSPARPNSILVTVVRLLKRKGNVLEVTGLDALDGSPILDIKPYLPDQQDSKDIRMPDWMKKMHDKFKEDCK